jgi:heme/copper-type cytochrome/quinol oxidase subunit 1
MDERLGRWSFWTSFVGFSVGFFPMHVLGLLGMPRRSYTYADGLGWGSLNRVVTLQPLGHALARMGHAVAAAAVQLPRHPDGGEPLPSVEGPPPRPSWVSR